ncbi:MAG: dihydroorotate dehydrogenase [Thermoleophilia bacterium]
MSGRYPAQPDLTTRLGPLVLAHPLINASGTMDLFEIAESLGAGEGGPGARLLVDPPVAAYVPKTVTLEPRRGNEPPRILETQAGMLNSIGLPNAGIEVFVGRELPRLLDVPRPLILNVGGFSIEDYVLTVRRLRQALDQAFSSQAVEAPWTTRVGLELNISCPNVHSGCMSIGADPGETGALLEAVRRVWPGLLMPKLTPNVTDITSVARAARDAGADALSLVNTFKGLALDRVSLRPYLGGVTGGLSGPAIKPLALRCVYEVAAAVEIPLVGMGGVVEVQDVVDFLACGASVVAIGCSAFRDPESARRLAEDLSRYLSERGVSLGTVIGSAHR